MALVEKINIFNKQAEERNGAFKLKKKNQEQLLRFIVKVTHWPLCVTKTKCYSPYPRCSQQPFWTSLDSKQSSKPGSSRVQVCQTFYTLLWTTINEHKFRQLTLTSECIFTILFPFYFLRRWKGEFFQQSRTFTVGDHFLYSLHHYVWFRGDIVRRN